jgi:hypothetical protein
MSPNTVKRHSRGRTAAAWAVASVALIAVTLGGVGSSSASQASLCQKVSSSEVGAALGLKVSKVTKDVNDTVTVCWYQVGKVSHAVFVRAQTPDNVAGYKADMKLAKSYNENPKADSNFAPYMAFSTTLGSTTYGVTYSVTVLKKSTELDIGGTGTTLAKVETLAKKILPIL